MGRNAETIAGESEQFIEKGHTDLEGFFDHVLRSNESYAQKWTYVRENPLRAGLAKSAEQWPYQGEIVYIDRA
jgi:hypothetical protein